MNQVTSKLRRYSDGYAHWCPGCLEMHVLPDTWKFNGNLLTPSFTPSLKHEGIKRVFVGGEWTGEWLRDALGNTIPYICHYVLTDGVLDFQNDCTHNLNNKSVSLPDLPEGICDNEII